MLILVTQLGGGKQESSWKDAKLAPARDTTDQRPMLVKESK